MRGLALFLLFAVSAAAQSAVEYSLGATRAGGAAAGMSKVGKGITISLEKASGKLGKSSGVQKWTPPKAPDRSKSKFEDPKGIAEGISVEELLRRFGDPDLKASAADGATKFWYGSVVAVVRDDKVASVSKPETAQAGVVVLQ